MEKYLEFVKDRANFNSYSYVENLLRAAVGLTSEYNEFIAEPSLDELGDCLFWWVILCDILTPDLNVDTNQGFNTGVILDCVEKKSRVGRAELDQKRGKNIDQTLNNQMAKFMSEIFHPTGFSMEEVCLYNMEKLRGRYAD